jgi:hypothetical protein
MIDERENAWPASDQIVTEMMMNHNTSNLSADGTLQKETILQSKLEI